VDGVASRATGRSTVPSGGSKNHGETPSPRSAIALHPCHSPAHSRGIVRDIRSLDGGIESRKGGSATVIASPGVVAEQQRRLDAELPHLRAQYNLKREES
jgi:hypothetical protein